jgi:hypothetical protein
MGFDAASVRAASAGLGALAGRASENGRTLIRAAHEACRLPEDSVAHGVRAGASAFLASPEGKAALHKALEAGWALLRGVFGGGAAGSPQTAYANQAVPAQGVPAQGVPGQGVAAQGVPGQGVAAQAVAAKGVPAKGGAAGTEGRGPGSAGTVA